MTLSAGYHAVPQGYLAAVVTYLEMTAPKLSKPNFPEGVSASHETLSADEYRALFRAVGEPWLWTSRLTLETAALHEIIQSPLVETWVIRRKDAAIGLVELDFREKARCELAFFGLVAAETGSGLGEQMMGLAQTRAFEQQIDLFHVHTCTLDAPGALGFYQRIGFTAKKREVEIFEDARINGVLDPSLSPKQPVL